MPTDDAEASSVKVWDPFIRVESRILFSTRLDYPGGKVKVCHLERD